MEDGVLHVVVGTQQGGRDIECGVSFGGQLPTQGLHKTTQHGIIMRLTYRDTHAVGVKTTNVNTGLQCLSHQLISRTGCFDNNGVEEVLVRNTVTSLLQGSGHTCRIRVQAFSNSAQPLGAVVHGVSTGNNRQQSLGGTDITGGLLTADVLLAGLQCQPVRRFT